MSLVAELTKLQERRAALLGEVALIDKELEAASMALGVPPTHRVHHSGLTRQPRPGTGRASGLYGQVWPRLEFWLRAQTTAKTRREIAEGAMLKLTTVDSTLYKNAEKLIHRGTRYGLSEAQFADHSADLEEQSRGAESKKASTSPIAPLTTGTTDTLNPLTTTASTAPVATEQVNGSALDSKLLVGERTA
jgi:hypothetical protein